MSDIIDRLYAFIFPTSTLARDTGLSYLLQETLLHDAIAEIRQLRADLKAARRVASRVTTFRRREDWHEDIGPVLWHHLDRGGRVCEPPVCAGDPAEVEAWAGSLTHWTLLPDYPQFGDRSRQVAPAGDLLCDLEGVTDA
jgi:hypothetical protein